MKWIPERTPESEWGITRGGTTADGAIARYTVVSEDYDEELRTRRTCTRYELQRGELTESVDRDWLIHWHTPQGFERLAAEAGLRVTHSDPVVDGEFTAFLQPASDSRTGRIA